MQIIVGKEDGNLETIIVNQVLEIKLDSIVKFRLKDENGKLKIFAKNGFLQIEPISSNVIVIDEKEDY